MPVTQPSYHSSGRKSHSLEGMLMCPLRGFSVLRDSFIPVDTKLQSEPPNAPLQPLSGQGGILQALEPGWESKEAVTVSLSAGQRLLGEVMVVGPFVLPGASLHF